MSDATYFAVGLVVTFWVGVKADISFRDLLDWREALGFLVVLLFWPLALIALVIHGSKGGKR